MQQDDRSPNAAFVGLWDVYAGPMYSQLVLQPNGTYIHSFWLGAQSHWGVWAIAGEAGNALIRLTLQGAQPMMTPGPFGPVPVQWPAFEQWYVMNVQPNQIALDGALMVRRPIAPQAAPPVPFAAPGAAIPAAASNQAPPLLNTSGPPAPMPAVDVAALANHSPQPAPQAPVAQNADILKQWQQQSAAAVQAQRDAMLAMYKQDSETNAEILKAQQDVNAAELQASQDQALDISTAAHAQAKKWIAFAGS